MLVPSSKRRRGSRLRCRVPICGSKSTRTSLHIRPNQEIAAVTDAGTAASDYGGTVGTGTTAPAMPWVRDSTNAAGAFRLAIVDDSEARVCALVVARIKTLTDVPAASGVNIPAAETAAAKGVWYDKQADTFDARACDPPTTDPPTDNDPWMSEARQKDEGRDTQRR